MEIHHLASLFYDVHALLALQLAFVFITDKLLASMWTNDKAGWTEEIEKQGTNLENWDLSGCQDPDRAYKNDCLLSADSTHK